MKMSILFVLACVLASCQLTNYVPPVTPQMATARKGQSVNLAMLHEGRTLFAHRCIECHTLPVVWRYSSKDWPGIVDSMSKRASLKPAEREAIIAYIIAVRLAEH
jgi:cytochrome c2